MVVSPKLTETPFFDANIKKLRNYVPETWRYRLGDFRIFYMVNEDKKEAYFVGFKDRKDACK